jgi:hypothetical protein
VFGNDVLRQCHRGARILQAGSMETHIQIDQDSQP